MLGVGTGMDGGKPKPGHTLKLSVCVSVRENRELGGPKSVMASGGATTERERACWRSATVCNWKPKVKTPRP